MAGSVDRGDHEHSLAACTGTPVQCDLCGRKFEHGYRCRVVDTCGLAVCSACYNRVLQQQMPHRRTGHLPSAQDWEAIATAALTNAVTLLLKAPLELCFAHQQTSVVADSAEWPSGVPPTVSGFFASMRSIVRLHDLATLFRGTSVTLFRLLPTELTEYLSKDYIRDHLKGDRKTSYYRWLGGAILSGAISNALSLVLVHPLDLAQTCVQVDLPRERFSGVFDCLSRTASKYGLRALYTGLGVRIASRFLYRSAYFVLYDVTQNALSRDAGQDTRDWQFIRGFVVTFLAEAAVHPFEVVARAMMVTQMPAQAVIRHTLATKGVFGLWAGIGQRTVEGCIGLGLMVGVSMMRQRPPSRAVLSSSAEKAA